MGIRRVWTVVCCLLLSAAVARAEIPVVGTGAPVEGAVDLELEHLWTVGSDEVLFGQVGAIHTDDDGTVFVLDQQLGEVQVIAPDGTWLRTIGREGEGPGEFRGPSDMFLTPTGEVAVVQQQPAKIARLAKDGTALDDAPLADATTGVRILFRGAPTREGTVLSLATFAPRDDGSLGTRNLVQVLDGRGETVAELFATDGGIDFQEMTVRETSMDNATMYWVVTTDDRLATVVAFDEYAIDVVELDGTPVHAIRRDVPPRARTAEELEAATERFSMNVNGRDVEVVAEPNARMVDGLVARPDGRLWAVRRETEEIDGAAGRILRLDEFDADGTYRRQLVLRGEPRTSDRVRLSGNLAFVIREETTDGLEGEITLSCHRLVGLDAP